MGDTDSLYISGGLWFPCPSSSRYYPLLLLVKCLHGSFGVVQRAGNVLRRVAGCLVWKIGMAVYDTG